MSLPPRTPFPSLIPESAPFTAEQRVWLDGLFAGLLSLEHGVTPLSLAATSGNSAMIDKLLRAGADANSANREGETVLMTAARTGKVDAVKALLDRVLKELNGK